MSACHTVPSMSPSERAHANRIGILWMIVAMTAFIGNDAMIKNLGERLPAAQMIVVRGVMAISLITVVAWKMGALPRIADAARGWVLLRAGFEGVGTFLYLAALFQLPLANATAINLSSPLFIAVLAMVFLHERVDRARWLAILAGFAGVLMVIQPRADGFNAYAWLCLFATLIYAFRDLLTRKVPPATPSILVTLSTASVVWLMAVVVLAWEGWQPMSWRDVGLLAIASVFLSAGYYSVIAATRHAEVSVVAPFRYVGLLWALVIGYVVWGDVPNLLAWCGIALLIGAGLFMMRQQRRR
ncbi:MAG: DMT family transporter [Burkholderiaceae bacterium]|nr:MAG: DMT family transporter [Burkholderiaceae bacterium]